LERSEARCGMRTGFDQPSGLPRKILNNNDENPGTPLRPIMAERRITAVIATTTLIVLAGLMTAARAGITYPVSRDEQGIITWRYAPSNKGLIGYMSIGGHGRARIYGVWRRKDGTVVKGQIPGNVIPIDFVKSEPDFNGTFDK